MNRTMILGVSIMAIFAIGTIATVPVAYAYDGLGSPTGPTLEEQLILAERKVQKAADNPATGSGTPYLDADGIRRIYNCRSNIWRNCYSFLCKRKSW